MAKARPLRERIEESVVVTAAGCWEWQRPCNRDGYGQISAGRGRNLRAHRASYEVFVGPIPEGLELDHLCRNRRCVNPTHLEPVTRAENARRSPILGDHHNRLKTHCQHGHPFTEENTGIQGRGWRFCRACRRRTQREAQSRYRAKEMS